MTVQEIVFWAVGILITVGFGLLGLRSYRQKNSQIQKSKSNSTSIQSGRDTNISNGK